MGGLWVAAGAEAAWGGGMPGPLLLVALAAGLWSGPRAGLLAGTAAGVCDAALFGQNLLVYGVLGMASGGGASLLTRWLSRHHLLVAVLCALVVSVLLSLLLGWSSYHHPTSATLAALGRGGENSLWMIAIYGILLVGNYASSMMMSRE